MKIHALVKTAAIAAAFTISPLSEADTLQISVSKQSPELQSISRPQAGMRKSSVEKIFGSPQAITGPVGEPAISSWSYQKFTVYFENNTVLHSVLRSTATAEPDGSPE